MSIRSGYNQSIVTLGIVLENQALDAAHRVEYLNWYGDHADWVDATDRADAVAWWYEQWTRIHPGVVNCEHGMSLQQCYGPAHYASDFEISQGW